MGEISVDTSRDVHLVVPAAAEYLRLVRLTAAGLASRMGFTFDEVEDLRIAVDEVCFLLLDESPTATIELRYLASPDSIGIEGSTESNGGLPEPNDLSMQILNALVDEVAITSEGGRLAFRMVKTKESF